MQNTDSVPEDQSLQTVETETRYPIETEEEPAPDRNWLMLAALAIAAIAFLVLLFFAGRWVYRSLHHDNKTKPTPAVTENPSEERWLKPNSSKSGSSVTPNSSNSSASGQIPNTGPGNVVALFAVASFSAASLHYVLSLRKQS